jgi:WD40 repeat protein
VARGGGKVDAFEVVVDSTIRPGERPWEALAAFVRRDARGRPLPPDVLARMGDPGEGNGERIGDLIFAPAGLRAVDRRGRATAWPERVGMDSRREEPEYEHLALAPDASFVARAARDATVLEIADPATGRVRARVDLGQRIQVLRAGPGVAAVGAFGVAGLYDPDGREIRVHRHDTTVTALALSADGRRFASCDIDNVSLVSDLASEAPPVRIRDRRRYARDARLSADGARLYLAHFGGTAAVWDLAAGETIRTLDAGPATGDRIAVAPDESRLAVGGNEVALFDLGDESVRRIDLALGADILRFDDAGARLLTVSRYGGAQLWDAADGTALPTAPGHTAKVAELIVLPDGDTVLAADQEGNLFRWSVATGEGTFLGYASGLLGIAAAPDGTIRRVFAGGSRPFALDAAEHRVAWRTEDAGDAAAASPDGSRLVVARRGVGADRGNARIERLNPEDGTVPETVPFPPAGRVEAIQVGNDGRLTARCDQALWRRPPGGEWEPVAEGIAVTSRDSISADGRFRWVSDGDAARRIDLETATVDELPGFRTYGGTGCLSDDGERLALVMHPDVVVLDVATAAERLRFEPQDGAVVSAAFFPGGDRLAVGMDDRTILVLEVPAAAPRADGPRGTGPRAGGT